MTESAAAGGAARPRRDGRRGRRALLVIIALGLAGCTGPTSAPATQNAPAGTAPNSAREAPTGPVAAVCDNLPPGPATPPAGAVTVDPAADRDISAKTEANPPGTTFWLAPGRHIFGQEEFAQVGPKDGNTYIGAPGAIVDGRGLNRYAFTGTAKNVTIRNLIVQGFVAPANEGVVNHDSGNGWVIENNAIEKNKGAGMMAGARQQVRGNCLRDNGQYGMNAFQDGNGITGLVVEGNEIVGNNTDDWESKIEGCGCTGGIKFWSVDRADVRGNWVHDNRGPGLWADTNDNDFLIEGNVIENNDGEAVFYETSYNLVLRNNVLRRNAIPSGKKFAAGGDSFPIAAVYLSEAGGEPRVPARTDKIDIYGNVFDNNWSGITAWENADRFCNSAANTSTGICTRLVPDVAKCSPPAITQEPLYSDCRWKTQRVDIHDNTFVNTDVAGCEPGYSGRMAILSNFGTFPDWSPYKGDVVQKAITYTQRVKWTDNRYTGPWTFMGMDAGTEFGAGQWQAAPSDQDSGSTFADPAAGQRC
jgi:hypothetical protein